MSKNIIKTIKIDIAGTEVEVTPEQAKQLHAALQDLLGLDKPAQVTVKEVIRDRYYPTWTYPTWTYTGTASPLPDVGKWTISYAAHSQSAALTIS